MLATIDRETLTAERIAQVASMGDRLAQKIIAASGSMLGIGLATAINFLNPQQVVLGGGVTKAGDMCGGMV